MTGTQFSELVESKPVISLKFDGYDMEINFGEVVVSITTEMDYDCPVWVFESNIEREQKRLSEEAKRVEFLAKKTRIDEILGDLDEGQKNELRTLLNIRP